LDADNQKPHFCQYPVDKVDFSLIMSVSEEEFRQALSRFASGVSVVTTRGADGKPHGITVSAFCSVSLVPPQVLICIEKVTASHPAFIESGAYVVNVLRRSQVGLSERFAAPALDKFGDIVSHAGSRAFPSSMMPSQTSSVA
jgi:flavin reductase (DIM6/NTAB) family NADH-FMN oxidoreductase RutF